MISLVLSILLSSSVYASQVLRISTAEGLSQSYVNTLLIDQDGYLWISTEGGLNRYDGYQVLEVNGPNGILNKSQIDSIYQDNQGGLWIASGFAGLMRYDPQLNSYKHYIKTPTSGDELVSNIVYQLLQKNDTEMWLGKIKGVDILDINTGDIRNEVTIPFSDDGFVRDLMNVDNVLLIATSEGLYAFDQITKKLRELTVIDNPKNKVQRNTKSLFLKDANTLLVGAVSGFYELDISEFRQNFDADVPYKTVLSEFNIWQILEGKNSNLILGTDKGVMFFEPDTGKLVRDTRLAESVFSPSDPSVIHMVKDNYGGLWVATREDGAFYLPDKEIYFDNVSELTVEGEGFSHGNVWEVTAFGDYLWLATNDGITRYNPQTRQTKQFLKGYLGDEIFPELIVWKIDKYNEKLWLTTSQGLFIFDPISHEVKRPKGQSEEDNKILNELVKGMQLLENGFIYFVNADAGMFAYDINKEELHKLTEGFEGEDPFLSFGFYPPLPMLPEQPMYYSGGILYRYDPQQKKLIEVYRVPQANPDLPFIINSYIIDKNNIFWMSLSTFGLVGLTTDTFEPVYNIDLKSQRIDSLLYEMREDDAGMIWMSSHKGIWRFDPDNLHLQQFTTQDGLLSNEFNGGASERLADGRLVYGMIKGIVIFDPKKARPKKPLLSKVNITSVDLMSRPYGEKMLKKYDSIELEHDNIGLEVSFSAMAFSYQDRIIYEYQISGGQKILSRNQNRVAFPKLNPGEYVLKVWAKDPLTGDYTPPAKLTIRVNYPIWRSPAAIAAYIFISLILLALWSYRKHRVEQLILAAHKETRDRETRLKMALEGSNSGVWEWHAGSTLLYQPRLVAELSYEQDSVSLDDYLQKIHPLDRAQYRLQWLEFVTTDKGFLDCTYRLRDSAGQWRWYKDFGKVLNWDQGHPIQVAGTYTNLTRERLFEERAILFGAAFEQIRDWVMILDTKLRIQACNNALQYAFGVDGKPVSSTSVTLGMEKQKRLHYLRQMIKLEVHQHFSAEERISLPDGEERDVLIKVSAIANGEGKLHSYVVVLTDITKQKRTEKELYQLANYDSKTRLPNKALLMDRVQHAIEQSHIQASQFALLAIRFHRLQHLYEVYGKECIDELLPVLAKRLRRCFREQDSLAVSYNKGFYVLMEQLESPEQITCYTQDLQQSFIEPIEIMGHRLSIQPYIGIAIYPDDAEDAFALNRAAKVALEHAALEQTPSYQFFEQEMNGRVQHFKEVEQALMHALKNGEFSNYYQPIVDVQSNRIVGFEALLRWPKNSSIGAQDFANVAEQTGVVTELTMQTLKRALIELRQWHLSDPTLYVSVNLSALDFQSPTLVEKIQQTLEKVKVDGKYVVFEITESVMMSNVPRAIERMHAIKELGCRLFMDDFGTGYASLTYLQQFPVDGIKVDKSFVMGLEQEHEHEAIIRSCLSLAQGLGLLSVAEGIEEPYQLAFLRDNGCNYYQGFYFSEPICGDKVNSLLQADFHPDTL
ncbi:EAL domain-containing protein [Pseudoalteromonas sp. T1lg65]|uniref:EAL domain-containing protein n=1 Tax=Pseudoalteromonas sp. T1lg65 TaxID=2077101 RepID=UPI003F7A34FD